MTLAEELKARGLIEQSSAPVEKILSAPRTVYIGVDPTADSLHVGHLAEGCLRHPSEKRKFSVVECQVSRFHLRCSAASNRFTPGCGIAVKTGMATRKLRRTSSPTGTPSFFAACLMCAFSDGSTLREIHCFPLSMDYTLQAVRIVVKSIRSE